MFDLFFVLDSKYKGDEKSNGLVSLFDTQIQNSHFTGTMLALSDSSIHIKAFSIEKVKYAQNSMMSVEKVPDLKLEDMQLRILEPLFLSAVDVFRITAQDLEIRNIEIRGAAKIDEFFAIRIPSVSEIVIDGIQANNVTFSSTVPSFVDIRSDSSNRKLATVDVNNVAISDFAAERIDANGANLIVFENLNNSASASIRISNVRATNVRDMNSIRLNNLESVVVQNIDIRDGISIGKGGDSYVHVSSSKTFFFILFFFFTSSSIYLRDRS